MAKKLIYKACLHEFKFCAVQQVINRDDYWPAFSYIGIHQYAISVCALLTFLLAIVCLVRHFHFPLLLKFFH
jgi:hypothetical protein